MFELLPESDGTVVAVKMTGTLTDADSQAFMPGLEQLISSTQPPRWYIDWEEPRRLGSTGHRKCVLLSHQAPLSFQAASHGCR